AVLDDDFDIRIAPPEVTGQVPLQRSPGPGSNLHVEAVHRQHFNVVGDLVDAFDALHQVVGCAAVGDAHGPTGQDDVVIHYGERNEIEFADVGHHRQLVADLFKCLGPV